MIYLLITILGLIVGSFLNAVIFRLHSGKSFMKGRSECMHCGHVLKAHDLVPVMSFVFLRGRCRYCQTKISWQYPLVELVTASAFLLLSMQEPVSSIEFWSALIFICFFIVIGVYDLKHFLILDKVLLPAGVLALVYSALSGMVIESLIGAVMVSGFFAAQYFFSKGKWIGFGDVKLGILLGLLFGVKLSILMLILGYFIGALTGLSLIAWGKKHMGSKLPLGSFLAISAIIVLIYGEAIVQWYFGLIGL